MSATVRVYCNESNGYHDRHGLTWISTLVRGRQRWIETNVPRGGASTGDGAEEYHKTSRHLVDSESTSVYRIDYKRAPAHWPSFKTPERSPGHQTTDGKLLIPTYVDIATRREYADEPPAHDRIVYWFKCPCGSDSGPVPEASFFEKLEDRAHEPEVGLTVVDIASWGLHSA